MKKALRALLAWLDRKFPDRVVVTLAEYNALKSQIEAIQKSVSIERIKKIESEINKFNAAMGFGNPLASQIQSIPFER